MSKRDWALVISLVLIMWLLDQGTKLWAVNNLGALKFYGPFGLVLHRNPGAMFGIFSDLPPLLRIVSLSTGGAFLIFVHAAIQYFLPGRSLILRCGMSILLGGILGNVTDRIFMGSVVDFLVIGAGNLTTPAFNIADMVQWIGYFMVVYSLIAQSSHLWPEKNARKKLWINPGFQLKYVGILLGVGTAFAIINCVFSFTYLKITIDELVFGNPAMIERKFIIPYLFTYLCISVTFLIMLFIIGRKLSHRTAGPLYAFEMFLEDILSGKDRPLRLREGDDLRHLEELAESVRQRLRANFSPTPRLVTQEEPKTGSE